MGRGYSTGDTVGVPSPTVSPTLPSPTTPPSAACYAVMLGYSYTVSEGWLYVNISSALRGTPGITPMAVEGQAFGECTLTNGITYVGGPVRQVVVYSGGQGYPVEAGNTWIEMSEGVTLDTSASIPLPRVGSYTFNLVAGIYDGSQLIADSTVPIVVSATYVPTSTSATVQPQTTPSLAESVRRWFDRYWWTIPIAALTGAVVYVIVDPPNLDELAKAIAGSKWARDWAMAFVNPSLPEGEREKEAERIAQWLGARVARNIEAELGTS